MKYTEAQVCTWLETQHIHTILDLRSPEEVQQNPYGHQIRQRVNYIHLPLPIRDFRIDRPEYEGRTPYEIMYLHYLLDCQDEIAQIFTYLATEENYNIVLHCHAGKDRTGFIIALILLLLEVPPTLIIMDYLSSGSDAEPQSLQMLLDTIEGLGGIQAYLESTGLLPDTLQRIRRILLESS